MKIEHKKTLIAYRLDRANEAIEAASLLLQNNLLTSAINRIYYSMFYAVQALLLVNDVSFSKHSQVKGFFNREYIKTEILPKKFGKTYNKVFEFRQKFDYIDLAVPEKEMIVDYINLANEFINVIHKFLHDNNLIKN